MNSNLMINPANYYNPFAKYNYVSKTRGVYIPKDTEPLLKTQNDTQKSSSIFSDSYDAEADILQSMNEQHENKKSSGIIKFIDGFFRRS